MKRRLLLRFALGPFLLAVVCTQLSLAQAPNVGGGSLVKAAALLDLSGAPDRIDAYRRIVDARGSTPEAQAARRRLVLLQLEAGHYDDAQRTMEAYRAAGGQDISWPQAMPDTHAPVSYVDIPGPLLSFERMAALRPDTSLDDLAGALARNVVTFGYEYSHRYMRVEATEYLKLLKSYLGQAREVQALAGSDGILRIKSCQDAAPLLRVIGYSLRENGCKNVGQAALEVDDPQRAFLTTNSGFPLVALEEAVQGVRPLELNVKAVRVPVRYGADVWQKASSPWIDGLINDRDLARVYLALSRLETSTAELLLKSPGVEKLKPYSAVLDFFGGMLRVEDGHVVVPGGPASYEGWKQITGVSPDKPALFITNLIQKDDGWQAAYFDVLSHTSRAQQAYFTEPARMVRFYKGLRSRGAGPGPARPIFRGTAQLMLLATRLRVDNSGRPYLPGGVATWKSLFHLRQPKNAGKKGKEPIPSLETTDEVVEALFGRVREADENGPLNIFLAINEIDRLRSKPLDSGTILLLAAQYPRFSQHYSVFAGWPQLGSTTIEQTLDVLESVGRSRDPLLRADALGSLQAVICLWEILGRQREIPEEQLEPTYRKLVALFREADNHAALVDAGRKAVDVLLAFAPEGASVQERMITMLAGPQPENAEATAVRDEVAARIRNGMNSQRLLPLDTLFTLADGLEHAGQRRPGPEFVKLASRLRELNLPNPFPSLVEKNAMFFGYWTERHIQSERDLDLARGVQTESPDKLARQRGQLAPHLRDTLVGLVYAYYAPPGSQLLANNPLFVRSHDFLGNSGQGTGNEVWGPGRVSGVGWPWSGGGRFVGALSGIAYALADAEKDFLVPQQTQSLIWGELAPQVLLSSTLPRWWGVSSHTLHWLALQVRLGQDLVAEAAVAPDARKFLPQALYTIPPRRTERIDAALSQGHVDRALALVTTSEFYQLARVALSTPAGLAIARRASPTADAIEEMAREYPSEASIAAVSAAFGSPHPKVARSFRPELLNLPLFPTLLGYSSRLLAESWESGNLYWAELADELALSPVELNRVAPQLTRETLERIFANDLEDWPALLSAMRVTGDDFKKKTLARVGGSSAAVAALEQ